MLLSRFGLLWHFESPRWSGPSSLSGVGLLECQEDVWTSFSPTCPEVTLAAPFHSGGVQMYFCLSLRLKNILFSI